MWVSVKRRLGVGVGAGGGAGAGAGAGAGVGVGVNFLKKLNFFKKNSPNQKKINKKFI